MPSKASDEALFQGPFKSDSLGSDADFGRLVACSALYGLTLEQTAEKAAVMELAARLDISEESALGILRGFKKRAEQHRNKP